MCEIVLCNIFLTFAASFHFCEESRAFPSYSLQLQVLLHHLLLLLFYSNSVIVLILSGDLSICAFVECRW